MAAVIADVHETATRIFRAVHERWQSSCGVATGTRRIEGDVSIAEPTQFGLAGLSGIHDGSTRLRRLLELATAFTVSKTADSIDYPLGRVVDLLTRLFLVVVPTSSSASRNLKLNDSISNEEKDALWTELPDIHISASRLAKAVCERFGTSAVSVHVTLMEHIEWTFRYEKYDAALRESAYRGISCILQLSGVSLQRQQIRGLGSLMQSCCSDIVPQDKGTEGFSTTSKGIAAPLNADSFLSIAKTPQKLWAQQSSIETAARSLLSTFLSRVPAQHISSYLRATLDRTAVLSEDKDAMFASCMNPPLHRAGEKPKASLLPLMARLYPEALETEALVRPRMPVVVVGERPDDEDDEMDEEEPVLTNVAEAERGRDLTSPGEADNALQFETAVRTASDSDAAGLAQSSVSFGAKPGFDPAFEISHKRPLSPDVVDAPSVEPVVWRDDNPQKTDETVMTMHVPGTKVETRDISQGAGLNDDDDFVIPPLYLNSSEDDEEDGEAEEEEGDEDDQPVKDGEGMEVSKVQNRTF